MNYLNAAFRNAVAYFIMDNVGIVKMIMDVGNSPMSRSAYLATTYTAINEGIDYIDDGRSNLTAGNYFRVADGAVWNFLYILGISQMELVEIADGILDGFGVPSGDVRISILNGVFITLANIIREYIDTSGPKQLRIATQPTSFLYTTANGAPNPYL